MIVLLPLGFQWVRCPICGDEADSFDRDHHTKTKHPEYYQESKKWRNAAYVPLPVIFISVLLYIVYFLEKPLTPISGVVATIAIISFATEFYIQSKMFRLIAKYKESPIDLQESV